MSVIQIAAAAVSSRVHVDIETDVYPSRLYSGLERTETFSGED
jgi:hypothetical protein